VQHYAASKFWLDIVLELPGNTGFHFAVSASSLPFTPRPFCE
jgi:hypothetical protein